jgi:acyl-CoA synthetase (NDP forming)
MNALFYPRSLAIFGVSNSPTNLARRILENLDRLGFSEPIYLLGEKSGTLSGRTIYASLEEIEATPDCAVLLVPARNVPKKLEECGRKGIRNVVIEAGGFSEFSDGKRTLEDDLIRIARAWQIRLVGPNCVGTINAETGLALPFYSLYKSDMSLGDVSIISQSGGLVHDIMTLCTAEGVGINKMVSVGNKLMTDENDFLEYFITDPATHTIGLYLENIAQGKRLMDLACSTDKPVVVLKGNTNPGGSEIAKFHTSALANDDTIVDAALKQAGIHRAHSLEEMVDFFKAFKHPLLKGPRLALIARSGGHAVLSADAVGRYGFTLARLSDQFYNFVNTMKKAEVIRLTNPLDLGDLYDLSIHFSIIEKACQEEGVDAVIFTHSYTIEDEGDSTRLFIESVNRLPALYGKPVVLCMISNKDYWFAMKDLTNPPAFTTVDAALRVLTRSLEHYRRKNGVPTHEEGTWERASSPPSGVLMHPRDAFNLLRSYHVPVAEFEAVKNLREGIEAARRIGFPVALKTAAPSVLHKTEQGGVAVNLAHEDALRGAFQAMASDEYLVQAMAGSGHEIIIGGKRDSGFGPVLLFGLGGTLVEVYRDIALRIAPIDELTAMEMIRETKGSVILTGFRGRAPADIKALSACMVNISLLLAEHPEIVALDINPLIVFNDGEGVCAVDVKVNLQLPPSQEPASQTWGKTL